MKETYSIPKTSVWVTCGKTDYTVFIPTVILYTFPNPACVVDLTLSFSILKWHCSLNIRRTNGNYPTS